MRRLKKSVSLLMVVLLVSGTLTLMSLRTQQDPNEVPFGSPVPARIAYVTHAPIDIDGNAGLLADNSSTGISWGSGTATDPYVIDGWEIDATGDFCGIYVSQVDAHFVISNLLVYNAMWGIALSFCSNGTVSHCTVRDSNNGIIISGTQNSAHDNRVISCIYGFSIGGSGESERGGHLIANNSVTLARDEGIYIVGQNHTITGNHIESSNRGIRTNGACNVTLRNNSCFHNSWGITLDSSNNCSVANNIIFDSTYSGLSARLSSNDNTIWNNTLLYNNGAGNAYDPSHVQVYQYESQNQWNSTYGSGNYWSDWTTPDNDFNGIVDSPYVIDVDGSRDYHPLSSPPGSTDLRTNASLSGTLGTNGWFQSIVSVSLSTDDFGRGVNATYYRFGTQGSWSDYTSSFIISDEANSKVDFFSIDNSSIVEPVKNMTVRIDRAAPTLIIREMVESEVHVDHVEISWVCSDATSGLDRIEVSLDGGAFAAIGLQTSHSFLDLTDGTHNVSVRAFDVAGNEIEKSVHFTVDAGWGDPILYGAIAAIVILVALAVIVIMLRKKESST